MRDSGETLRRIALRDESIVESMQAGVPSELDYRTCGIAQIAALIATGGSLPSYARATAIARLGGATASEIVAILLAVAPIAGVDRSVAEAPTLGLALGYDVHAWADDPPIAPSGRESGHSGRESTSTD